MIKKLLLLYLITKTLQTCSKGCLKCSPPNTCEICDTTLKYILTDKTCTLSPLQSCLYLNLSGECLTCDTNHYLNATTKKCVEVELEKKVLNCKHYSSEQSCAVCEANYWVSSAKCVVVEKSVLNCEVYDSESSCAECGNGYYLGNERKSCLNFFSITDCSSFSRFECDFCKSGFFVNRNLYFDAVFKSSTTLEKDSLLVLVRNSKEGKQLMVNHSVCQAVKIKNCAEYETFDKCKTCLPNNFLKEDKTCEEFPKSIILNCVTYSSGIECKECSEGYYRESGTKCVKITETVPNCLKYSQTTTTVQCIKCQVGFYLENATSCLERVFSKDNIITNCDTKSDTEDKCTGCNEGFVLSSLGKECKNVVANCLTHLAYSQGGSPTCNICNNGYYLSVEDCLKGTDDNCLTFERNIDSCKVCKNKFWKIGSNPCETHSTIDKCLVYDKSSKNQCQTCTPSTFHFIIEKKCKILPKIENCLTYDHDKQTAPHTLCKTCKNGYYLSSSKETCTLINITNCESSTTQTPSVCTGCLLDYHLFLSTSQTNTLRECRLTHEYLSDQCLALAPNDSGYVNQVTCLRCKENSVPVDYERHYVCVSDDYLKDDDIGVLQEEVIDGCLKYDDTESAQPTCAVCEAGKFLASDRKSCVGECASGSVLYSNVLHADGADFFVIFYNWCKTESSEAEVKSLTFLTGDNISVKCRESRVTHVDLTLSSINYSHFDLDGAFGNYFNDLGRVTPEVNCASTINDINGNGNNFVNGCEYYIDLTGNNYGCIKCSHGLTGKSEVGGKYISSCSSMTSCQNIKYGMIPPFWSKLFSCHACITATQVPFLFYKFSPNTINFNNFSQYDLKNSVDFTDSSANESNTIECLSTDSKSSFKQDIGDTTNTISDTKITFIPNCGLYIYNISTTRSSFTSLEIAHQTIANGENSTIYCSVCKPGYKATKRSDTNTVTLCEEISNCKASSTWFENCSECKPNFVFKYDMKIRYDECVAYTADKDCFAASAENTECVLCKKGFAKNRDGFCEKINTPKCQFDFFNSYFKTDNDFGYMMWYSEKGAGCNECDSGYSAVLYKSGRFSQYACRVSDYVVANVNSFPNQPDGVTKSNFINFCISYKTQNPTLEPVCDVCGTGYVLRNGGTECIVKNNCLLVASVGSDNCTACESGYGLVGGNCVIGTTSNCAEYNSNSNQSSAVCQICNSGYYLSTTNSCEKGFISNCKTFANKNSCSECEDGFMKIEKSMLNGGYDYCFKINPDLNCLEFTIGSNDNGATLTCTKCTVDYSVIQTPELTSEIKSDCLEYNVVNNCESYNVLSNLVSSSFLCVKCITGFYLTDDGFSCVLRKFDTSKCAILQIDADLCEECKIGYFLTTNKDECLPYPSGVIGCTNYTNATTCTACGTDYYFSENKCIAVTDKIENCFLYSNNNICSECNKNFYLENNICHTVTVNNCLTLVSKDACETCIQGHRLITSNNKTNCETFTKPNCLLYTQSGLNPCLECGENHYIDTKGDCQLATPLIPNCISNESSEICKKCRNRFALSVDRKSCVDANIYDQNCREISMPSQMSCAQCDAGYFFEEGVCKAFKTFGKSEGCFIARLDGMECVLCDSGWFMNSLFGCERNLEVVEGDGGQGGDESMGFRRFFGVFVGFVIFW